MPTGSGPIMPRKRFSPARQGCRLAETCRLDHVSPGGYFLRLSGKGFSEKTLAIDVPEKGAELGSIHIDVLAHGDGSWAASTIPRTREAVSGPLPTGWVRSPALGKGFNDEIRFQADENGRFAVERVPAGLVRVGFPFQVYDVIYAHVWSALVVEGQTAVVLVRSTRKPSANCPSGSRSGTAHRLRSLPGPASPRRARSTTSRPASRSFRAWSESRREPMFRIDLAPRSTEPLAFAEPDWENLDPDRRVVLPDVGPGSYRLRVFDWLGSTTLNSGPLFETDVRVPRPKDDPAVRVALAAGCITGRVVPAPKDVSLGIEAIAVPREGQAPARRGRADYEGNFCVRYLDPGTYTLFVHDPKSGYCKIDGLVVPAGVVDVGERELHPGGSIHGSISYPRPCPVPDEIVLTGPEGADRMEALEGYTSSDHFEVGGLWPGLWRIAARAGGKVMATATVKVPETGRIQVRLMAGQRAESLTMRSLEQAPCHHDHSGSDLSGATPRINLSGRSLSRHRGDRLGRPARM